MGARRLGTRQKTNNAYASSINFDKNSAEGLNIDRSSQVSTTCDASRCVVPDFGVWSAQGIYSPPWVESVVEYRHGNSGDIVSSDIYPGEGRSSKVAYQNICRETLICMGNYSPRRMLEEDHMHSNSHPVRRTRFFYFYFTELQK